MKRPDPLSRFFCHLIFIAPISLQTKSLIPILTNLWRNQDSKSWLLMIQKSLKYSPRNRSTSNSPLKMSRFFSESETYYDNSFQWRSVKGISWIAPELNTIARSGSWMRWLRVRFSHRKMPLLHSDRCSIRNAGYHGPSVTGSSGNGNPGSDRYALAIDPFRTHHPIHFF